VVLLKPLFLLVVLLVADSMGTLWGQEYVLLPDSIVTPYSGGVAGPSQTLSGSFSWTSYTLGGTTVFQLTSLNFTSSSFTLSLNLQNNDDDPDILSNGVAYFNAELLMNGSSQDLLLSSTDNNGTYTGLVTAPTNVKYPKVSLSPSSGGLNVAVLSIDAEDPSSPEPSTWALLLCGLSLLFFYGRRTRLTV
jgi:hypothetical protein